MKTKFKTFLNEYSTMKNIDLAQKIGEELGEEIDKYLGNGAFGIAYSTKSGKVLKLTSDIEEFDRAYALSRNKNWSKYIINYYNVGYIRNKQHNLIYDYNYYILMDQVLPLNIQEKSIISQIPIFLLYKLISNKKFVEDEFINNLLDQNEHLLKKDIEKILPHIINIVKELKRHHITDFDFHSGNVGWSKDKKNLVFFDIGGNNKMYSKNNKSIIVDAQTYKTANDLNPKSLIQIVDENDKNCGQAIIMKSLKTLYHVKYKTKLYKVRKIDVNTNIHGQAQLELIKLIMI
ncbi:hypothetical protein M0Q97_04295 [Candidatus Dojkabacteria bacterium]|jgi:hypothetical protein|nr:hypothetical protein [Candidatus Dojkabacteria bacterium]